MFELGRRRHNTGVRMSSYPDETVAHHEERGGEDGGSVGSVRFAVLAEALHEVGIDGTDGHTSDEVL